jgi:hypothetical protein
MVSAIQPQAQAYPVLINFFPKKKNILPPPANTTAGG